jgi:murein DD-endopeptidase MepM/ murein hydrolase activator NlpD
VVQLRLPFTGSPPILQQYANIWWDPVKQIGEPDGFRYPDGSIGYRPITDPRAVERHWHNGIDYGLPMHSSVLAPADGTVIHAGRDNLGFNGSDSGFGNLLMLDHGDVITYYGHLTEILVTFGDHVRAGQLIARSGGLKESPDDWRQGFSTAAHLHWSVQRKRDRRFVTPNRFLVPALVPRSATQVHHVPFHVTADKDGKPVTVFVAPKRTALRRRRIPGGSRIDCTGWTLGDAKWDAQAPNGGQWDRRWYQCADGWVASARVQGDAPGSTP